MTFCLPVGSLFGMRRLLTISPRHVLFTFPTSSSTLDPGSSVLSDLLRLVHSNWNLLLVLRSLSSEELERCSWRVAFRVLSEFEPSVRMRSCQLWGMSSSASCFPFRRLFSFEVSVRSWKILLEDCFTKVSRVGIWIIEHSLLGGWTSGVLKSYGEEIYVFVGRVISNLEASLTS